MAVRHCKSTVAVDGNDRARRPTYWGEMQAAQMRAWIKRTRPDRHVSLILTSNVFRTVKTVEDEAWPEGIQLSELYPGNDVLLNDLYAKLGNRPLQDYLERGAAPPLAMWTKNALQSINEMFEACRPTGDELVMLCGHGVFTQALLKAWMEDIEHEAKTSILDATVLEECGAFSLRMENNELIIDYHPVGSMAG